MLPDALNSPVKCSSPRFQPMLIAKISRPDLTTMPFPPLSLFLGYWTIHTPSLLPSPFLGYWTIHTPSLLPSPFLGYWTIHTPSLHFCPLHHPNIISARSSFTKGTFSSPEILLKLISRSYGNILEPILTYWSLYLQLI